MKKLILLILILMSVSFSQQLTKTEVNNWIGRVQGSPDSLTTSDATVVFTCNTKWRNDFDVATFEGHTRADFSKMTFVINTDKGIGYLWDDTETILSFYKLNNVLVINGNKNGTYITAIAESNVHNLYTMVVNDYTDVIVMTGEIGHVVIRRMYNIQ